MFFVVSRSHHLVRQQQDCLQAELAGAEVEQVLQTGTQQLHHHDVVVAFRSTPLDRRDSHCSVGRSGNVRKLNHLE